MPWPGTTIWHVTILLLVAIGGPSGVQSEGNVGCLFSERLCLEEEWCYDDHAFGRCLLATPDLIEDELYRYTLEKESLHQISRELQRLFALGYRWSHGYTQCRLQALLYTMKNDLPFEVNSCSHLADQDLEGALKVMEGQDSVDPQEVAIIKYTPSADNPHANYADEVYYPPVNPEAARETLRERILGSNGIDLTDMQDPLADYQMKKRMWIPQMHRRSLPAQYLDNSLEPDQYEETPRTQLEFLPQLTSDYDEVTPQEISELPEETQAASDFIEDMKEMYPLVRLINRMSLRQEEVESILPPEQYEKLIRLLDRVEETARTERIAEQLAEAIEERNLEQQQQQNTYNFMNTERYPNDFDDNDQQYLPEEDIPESRIYFDENDGLDEVQEYGSGYRKGPDEIFRELKSSRVHDLLGENAEIFRELKNKEEMEREKFARFNKQHSPKNNGIPQSGIYTEGGVVYVPDNNIPGESSEMETSDFEEDLGKLLEQYNLGFKRPERLDVKKPGPPFNTQINEAMRGNLHREYNTQEDTLLPSMMKKIGGFHPNPLHDLYDIDSNYVFVSFKQSPKSWTHSQHIIRNISALLHLEPSAFVHGLAERNRIMFRVAPNSRGLNATEVAKKIELIKDQLKERTGMDVISTGIGDRSGMVSILSMPMDRESQFYIIIFMVCGVLGAMIVAAALLILIKRHIKSKEKLQGLARPDTEASKDYQDLCRARMAAKGQPVNDTVHGRVTSLSRESEQSPSSRSSTSSWSEEPALHMDISTGHMVLSYMEDHLKNKDRLEQEWVALCAYMAEPCETTVALKKENVDKNRYPNVLPYDHSRVVLNELSNASGSDYINASSITDHDPRNPPYIATQGPLPHTAPDFWQLIWEQGAVVIVMLSRLTEGGVAMCHRYWPEEGSELYHIYEVHLVSEHIWCDDYLVRSFYLKNVKTGETRTVTQFHFLSWPESGVPASTKALLEFRRKVNKSYRGRSCPIVVHCSDGSGRAGTYCLIDMVLTRMAKGTKEIDIAATLEHLRDQRQRMVATKQQFEFVLTAVAEEVHAILKALPPQPAPAQAEKEKQ